MKNINRFLENSHRTDLRGFNMDLYGRRDLVFEDNHPDLRRQGAKPEANWAPPSPGLPGIFILGHDTNVADVLTLTLTVEGKDYPTVDALTVTRHRWTPAWMDTYYRTPVEKEVYPCAGTLCLREKKCITRRDVFCGEITLQNALRETRHVKIGVKMPFTWDEQAGAYPFRCTVATAAAGGAYQVEGYAAVCIDGKPGCVFETELAAFFTVTFRYGMAIRPEAVEAQQAVQEVLHQKDPFQANEDEFNRWFDTYVPRLETENSDLLKVYYYRWFVVYHGIHNPVEIIKGHKIPRSSIYESRYGGWFGGPIGLPVPWQIEEAKWMRRPEFLMDHMTNWMENLVLYQGYIQFSPWAIWHAYQLHPDKAWLEAHYEDLKKYMATQVDVSDPQPRITVGSWGTGAEYQPSFYQHTDILNSGEKWDWRCDCEGHDVLGGFPVSKLYRLDEQTYTIVSLKGCEALAREIGQAEDADKFRRAAEKLSGVLLEKHWDEKAQMFYDCEVSQNLKCDEAACYDSFAPFMGGVAGEKYHAAFEKLMDRNWFRTDFGATTAAKNCPVYWPDNCIAGPVESSPENPHYYPCSWNGPVWVYANSIVSDAFGCAAVQNKSLRADWLNYFTAVTEMHFPGGDRSTPLVTEQYRPDDGASNSVINDYFHSSWLNPFIQYYLGVRMENGDVTFDPFTTEDFTLSGVMIAGKEHTFRQWHDEEGNVRREVSPKP